MADYCLAVVICESDFVLDFESTECNQEVPGQMDHTSAEHVSQWCVFEVAANGRIGCEALRSVLYREPGLCHVKGLQQQINRT